MSDEQSELHRLREEAIELQRRLDELNCRLDAVVARPSPAPPAPPAPPPPVTPPPIVETPPVVVAAPPVMTPPPVMPVTPKESFEVRLGTYWLPRIGMAVLLTGLVFLVTWSYQYLGRGGKVALSYLCCAVLGGLGLWLEKRMPQFGRILQAGGMALAYFVTYAMHFSEALRVIEGPTLALALLAIVVAGIVIVADRRKSALLAGMALFFGYYTSVVSGVATFTLVSNAVLALAAIFFLARNRWVPISYGAVLATYVTYMIWVWKLSRWGDIDHLVFEAGYLDAAEFRLRAGFLSLYWLLFAGGAMLVRRDAMSATERNGLLTLNNVFFFLLFTLLMHHAYPGLQWRFHLPFGGALFVTSALAYQRFAPERSLLDALFVQGVAVGTLGLASYFDGGRLAAALAVESLLLLWLARQMASAWLPWVARAAFAIALCAVWPRYPGLWTAWFAAAVGFVCARVENRANKSGTPLSLGALYFAFVATAMAMRAAEMYFDEPDMPWVWTLGAMIVAVIAAGLRTRAVFWAAHLPLGWALAGFWFDQFAGGEWTLAAALMLIVVTIAFGLIVWGRARARGQDGSASGILWPYGLVAMVVTLVAMFDHCPETWMFSAMAGEALVLVVAAARARERVFGWLALAVMVVGAMSYLAADDAFLPARMGWANLTLAAALLIAAERVNRRAELFSALSATTVAVLAMTATWGFGELIARRYLTVGWAMLGFVLLAVGFAFRQRSYRVAGLVVLALSLARVMIYDLARLDTPYRILSFIGLGAILLVLGFVYTKNREKLAKWL